MRTPTPTRPTTTITTDVTTVHDHSGRDLNWLRLAAHVATTTPRDYGSFPLGAVVVKAGSVLATGANKLRNRDVFHVVPKTAWSVHAETAAISAARGSTTGATLYVARVARDGTWRPAAPCPACTRAAHRAGIRRIIAT